MVEMGSALHRYLTLRGLANIGRCIRRFAFGITVINIHHADALSHGKCLSLEVGAA